MEWESVNPEDYKRIFGRSQTVFHSADFNALNRSRADETRFFVFGSSSICLGCILGKKNNTWYSPFSSPFGGIEMLDTTQNELLSDSVKQLPSLFLDPVQLTLPPDIYSLKYKLPSVASYFSEGWEVLYTDLNYHFDLNTEYTSNLQRNARKNLNKALSFDHRFVEVQQSEEKKLAYSIIETNRQEKGYPLKMSFEQIQLTNSVVPMDFFLLEIEGKSCASSLVYRLNESAAMIVYWGHLEVFSAYRPVNLLAHYLFDHYKSLGFELLDVGPSSEFGILNEGLAQFKLSLGCKQTEKHTIRYERN
jgi:hypothetical protein